jgi:hypothetical protein
MRKMLAIIAGCIIIASCTNKAEKGVVSSGGEINREWVEEGITRDAVYARGIGAADQTLENKTQRMATSRNAAIVNAQYNLLSMVKGVELEGGITVEKAIETDSLLATKIDAVIKGAQVVRTEWTADDGCVVILKLPKSMLKELGLKLKE